MQTTQNNLPEDPMDLAGSGVRYLRLTNECPAQGIVLMLRNKPEIEHNDNFDKDEYQWPIIQWTPEPHEKILSESTPGFMTALAKATNKQPYEKVLQIKWVKVAGSKGRTFKDWTIRILAEPDIKAIFAQ